MEKIIGFTPGPWEPDYEGKDAQIYNYNGVLVVDRIARRQRTDKSDDGKFSRIERSNAQLIALAPTLYEQHFKMLEALKTLTQFFTEDQIDMMVLALADLWLRLDNERIAGYKAKQEKIEQLQTVFMHMIEPILSDVLHNQMTLKFNEAIQTIKECEL